MVPTLARYVKWTASNELSRRMFSLSQTDRDRTSRSGPARRFLLKRATIIVGQRFASKWLPELPSARCQLPTRQARRTTSPLPWRKTLPRQARGLWSRLASAHETSPRTPDKEHTHKVRFRIGIGLISSKARLARTKTTSPCSFKGWRNGLLALARRPFDRARWPSRRRLTRRAKTATG